MLADELRKKQEQEQGADIVAALVRASKYQKPKLTSEPGDAPVPVVRSEESPKKTASIASRISGSGKRMEDLRAAQEVALENLKNAPEEGPGLVEKLSNQPVYGVKPPELDTTKQEKKTPAASERIAGKLSAMPTQEEVAEVHKFRTGKDINEPEEKGKWWEDALVAFAPTVVGGLLGGLGGHASLGLAAGAQGGAKAYEKYGEKRSEEAKQKASERAKSADKAIEMKEKQMAAEAQLNALKDKIEQIGATMEDKWKIQSLENQLKAGEFNAKQAMEWNKQLAEIQSKLGIMGETQKFQAGQQKSQHEFLTDQQYRDYLYKKDLKAMELANKQGKASNLPLDQQVMIRETAKRKAQVIGTRDSLQTIKDVLADPSRSTAEKRQFFNDNLKAINSQFGPDAVGTQEAERMMGFIGDMPSASLRKGFGPDWKGASRELDNLIKAKSYQIQKADEQLNRYTPGGSIKEPVGKVAPISVQSIMEKARLKQPLTPEEREFVKANQRKK